MSAECLTAYYNVAQQYLGAVVSSRTVGLSKAVHCVSLCVMCILVYVCSTNNLSQWI